MRRRVHFVFSLVLIGVFVLLILLSGRVAVSRLLGNYATLTADLAPANEAVYRGTSDPEAHRKRAEVLYHLGQLVEAGGELEQAASLRPRDYHLWLSLGAVRDQNEDAAGALLAFNEAVRLAPYYAQPRWQRGNLLLRLGRFDEAFVDLRLATISNPELAPSLIDIAWSLSKGDVAVAERLAQVAGVRMRVAFAHLLAQRGRAGDAVTQFQAAADVSNSDRRELVQRLINAKAFKEAFAVWRPGSSGVAETGYGIFDGGFEGVLNLNEMGFGWRAQRNSPGVRMSQDLSGPRDGVKSLRIEFLGDSSSGAPLVSQFVVLQPETRYRLSFARRTREIVSGALPLIVVHDASQNERRLGQSMPLPQGTSDWEVASLDFTTAERSGAVVVSLEREPCSSASCPIFGNLWLDSFAIEQLPVNARQQ